MRTASSCERARRTWSGGTRGGDRTLAFVDRSLSCSAQGRQPLLNTFRQHPSEHSSMQLLSIKVLPVRTKSPDRARSPSPRSPCSESRIEPPRPLAQSDPPAREQVQHGAERPTRQAQVHSRALRYDFARHRRRRMHGGRFCQRVPRLAKRSWAPAAETRSRVAPGECPCLPPC